MITCGNRIRAGYPGTSFTVTVGALVTDVVLTHEPTFHLAAFTAIQAGVNLTASAFTNTALSGSRATAAHLGHPLSNGLLNNGQGDARPCA